MKHFERKWKSNDGLEIFAQGWNPESDNPRAVACLIHGIGEHTSRYSHVADAFTGEGFALFGADLRGHGRSEGPRGHFPSSDAILHDIDLLFDHARELYPGIPLILYGHSLGSILGLYYVMKQKPGIRGVIVTGTVLHNALEEQKLKVFAAKILGSLMPGASIPTGLYVNAVSRDSKVVEAYIHDPLNHNKMSFGFGLITLNIMKWTLEHAGEFPLPILMMHGKADSIGYPSSSIEFAAKLDNRCKLVLWEGLSHELHNEPEKAEVLKTMTDWINDLLKK
jgi:alpha-beta hydrolase superfamily lysophospholipase